MKRCAYKLYTGSRALLGSLAFVEIVASHFAGMRLLLRMVRPAGDVPLLERVRRA